MDVFFHGPCRSCEYGNEKQGGQQCGGREGVPKEPCAGGETAVRRPALLIRRPRGGGAGAAAWFISVNRPDIAGRASLGNDDFLAYFQGEVGRYFLLYFHKFVRILELDAHADPF